MVKIKSFNLIFVLTIVIPPGIYLVICARARLRTLAESANLHYVVSLLIGRRFNVDRIGL